MKKPLGVLYLEGFVLVFALFTPAAPAGARVCPKEVVFHCKTKEKQKQKHWILLLLFLES